MLVKISITLCNEIVQKQKCCFEVHLQEQLVEENEINSNIYVVQQDVHLPNSAITNSP